MEDQWTRLLSSRSELQKARNPRHSSPCLRLLKSFGEARWKSILILECGVSTEPEMLAQEGYEVTAIDVSPTAIAYARAHPATPAEIDGWFAGETFAASRLKGELIHQVSTLDVIAPQRQPDVIYAPSVSEQLIDASPTIPAGHAYRILKPGGACLVHLHTTNDPIFFGLIDEFSAAGFFWEHRRSYQSNLSSSYNDYLKVLESEREETVGRLERGDKMLSIFRTH
jgi:SAM-dependent methyltransferase